MSSANSDRVADRGYLIALLMMRCRSGTVQGYGRAVLGVSGGPGSAAHRFAPPRAQIINL
ncbi:MAG: hypothetical protein WAN75_34550 [Xanthobacteraceae bacterium]